ncbi:MAG: hypothetical protein WCT39_00570 [Candidatus Margulisiibacteriota bacterium]
MSKIMKFVVLFSFLLVLAGSSMASSVYTVLCVVNNAGMYGLPSHSFMDSDNRTFDLTWKTVPSTPPSSAIAGATVTIIDKTGSSSKTLTTDKYGRTAPFLAYAGDWIYVSKADFISQAYFQISSDPYKVNEDRLIVRISLKPIPATLYPIKVLEPTSSK